MCAERVGIPRHDTLEACREGGTVRGKNRFRSWLHGTAVVRWLEAAERPTYAAIEPTHAIGVRRWRRAAIDVFSLPHVATLAYFAATPPVVVPSFDAEKVDLADNEFLFAAAFLEIPNRFVPDWLLDR